MPAAAVLRPRPHAAGRRQRAGAGRRRCAGRRGGSRALPGERLVVRLFNTVGETLPAIAAGPPGRHAWPRAARRRRCGRPPSSAAEVLLDLVQPFAAGLFAEHRGAGPAGRAGHHHALRPGEAAGRRCSASTTSWRPATACDADGTYDGTIDGPFVWSTGKLDAVREWADEPRRRPRRRAGSTPTASTTRRCCRRSVTRAWSTPTRGWSWSAAARRWPILHLDVPPGVPKLPLLGIELQKLALAFARPDVLRTPASTSTATSTSRRRGRGHHRRQPPLVLRRGGHVGAGARPHRPDGALPRQEGGVRRAGDRSAGPGLRRHPRRAGHRLGRAAARRPPRRSPPASWWRSCRRAPSPAAPAFFDPMLKGRWGAARLAAMTEAPVIPVGLWGTEKVWPRSAGCPNMLNVLQRRPTVPSGSGRPVELEATTEPGRRHEADHGGHRWTCCRPRPAGRTSRPPRSWPPRQPRMKAKARADVPSRTSDQSSTVPSIASRQEVEVAAVAGGLLDHVDDDPAQRHRCPGARS